MPYSQQNCVSWFTHTCSKEAPACCFVLDYLDGTVVVSKTAEQHHMLHQIIVSRILHKHKYRVPYLTDAFFAYLRTAAVTNLS